MKYEWPLLAWWFRHPPVNVFVWKLTDSEGQRENYTENNSILEQFQYLFWFELSEMRHVVRCWHCKDFFSSGRIAFHDLTLKSNIKGIVHPKMKIH